MPQWLIDRYWEYDPIYDAPHNQEVKVHYKHRRRHRRRQSTYQVPYEDIILYKDPHNPDKFYTIGSYPHYHHCRYASDIHTIKHFAKEEWEYRLNTPRSCTCDSPYVTRPIYDPEAAGVSRVCNLLESMILRDRARFFGRINAGG